MKQDRWLIWLSADGTVCGALDNGGNGVLCSAVSSTQLQFEKLQGLYANPRIDIWVMLNQRDTAQSLRLDFEFEVGKPSDMDSRIVEFITGLAGSIEGVKKTQESFTTNPVIPPPIIPPFAPWR